jgi:hypothetical protein
MAAGDKVQIGKQFKVEFGGAVWTGYQFQSLTNSKTANVESVVDIRGANTTHIITNPAQQIAITAMIENASGSIEPPDVGDYFAITIPGATRPSAWILLSPATVTHSNSVSTISATLTREDSMSAGYETAISGSLDSNAENYSLGSPAVVDVGINYSAWATSISQVLNGSTPLTLNTNYSIETGPVLRIAQAYIAANVTNPDDEITLTVRFNAGNDATLVITATA